MEGFNHQRKEGALKRIASNLKLLVTKDKPPTTTSKPLPLYSIITQMMTADGIRWKRNGTTGMEFTTTLQVYNIFRETITVTLWENDKGEFFAIDEAPGGGRRRHLVTEFRCNDGRELWQHVDGRGRTMYSSGVHERELRGLIEKLDERYWGRGAWILRDGDGLGGI